MQAAISAFVRILFDQPSERHKATRANAGFCDAPSDRRSYRAGNQCGMTATLLCPGVSAPVRGREAGRAKKLAAQSLVQDERIECCCAGFRNSLGCLLVIDRHG